MTINPPPDYWQW